MRGGQSFRLLNAVAQEQGQRFSCGHCGETFASKNAKAKHKQACSPVQHEQPCEDQDLYADTRRHITARIKALADAEWQAMDWRGQLPDNWPEIRAEIERRFA
jgi:hypothetical protein